MTTKYLQLLETLSISYNAKKNQTTVKGFGSFSLFKAKVIKLSGELASAIQNGELRPEAVIEAIENFRLGSYNYAYEHASYKLHRCFRIDPNHESVVLSFSQIIRPIENANRMLFSLCTELKANKKKAQHMSFDPSFKLNIPVIQFFNVLYQMSVMTLDENTKVPLIEINATKAASQFARFCSDSKRKPIASATISRCFAKDPKTRRSPSGEKQLVVVMK
ncbi:MAG: hypothetical protein ACYC1Q_14260 [Bacteroidia bacterium]